jgi:tetratricopeptide (TPR) repeat protein
MRHTAARPSRRTALWLALHAVPLFAAIAFSQASRVPTTKEPNLFGFRRGIATPEGRAFLPAWWEAVASHEPGVEDAAVAQIATWSQDRLQQVIGTFLELGPYRQGEFATPMADAKTRGAVLHTDIAVFSLRGGTPDHIRKAQTPAMHFGAAMDLVDDVRRHAKDDVFPRLWYRAVAACLVAHHEVSAARAFAQRAASLFDRDAEALLLAGGVHEFLASPRIQEAVDLPPEFKEGHAPASLLRTAETYHRKAIQFSPELAEARGHLGRILGLRRGHATALAELTRALAEDLPDDLVYVFTVFVGQAEEALKHPDAARGAFRQAIDMKPGAQFAYLALSRLERGQGNDADAASALRRMLSAERGPEAYSDPWAGYYATGLARQLERVLDDLRQPFRRPQ